MMNLETEEVNQEVEEEILLGIGMIPLDMKMEEVGTIEGIREN